MYPSKTDELAGGFLRLVAIFVSALAVLILLFLIRDSQSTLAVLGWRLVSDASWHPTATEKDGTFGLLPIIMGTVLVTLGATLVAAPLGIGSAIYCQFYAPRRLARLYRRLVELLAGIPSVVFGFWGLVVLAPLIAKLHPPGPSLLAGIVVVGLMILPTIMLITESALAAVPRPSLHAAVALGMGRWAIIRSIVIPSAQAGILTGIILGAARAIGETMAVVMICGNVVRMPRSLFDPVRTLTANIALEMGYAEGYHRGALFVSGLLLLVLSISLVIVVELLYLRASRLESR